VPARLDLSLRTVRYHLATLEDEGALVTYRNGRRVFWYPAKLLSRADRELIAALRVRGERVLLQILLREGPSRFSSLERYSRLAPRSVSRHLRSLLAVGLVTVSADRSYEVAEPDRVARQLESFRMRFPDLMADAAREIFEGI
jgi:DNA-binding transcriptional ArsR family regulator